MHGVHELWLGAAPDLRWKRRSAGSKKRRQRGGRERTDYRTCDVTLNILQGENTGTPLTPNTTPCDRILVQTRHTDAIKARAACATVGEKDRSGPSSAESHLPRSMPGVHVDAVGGDARRRSIASK